MERCRVVLVRTEIAGNIGSTARIMRNFGVADLVLVSPVADHSSEQAEMMATHHARELLRGARVVTTLEEALGDCVLVAATSACTGGLYRRQTVYSPADLAGQLAEAMPSGPVALVFGPEPHGLSNDEVSRCNYLVHIPTDPTYSALNLAQSVAICLYELRKAHYLRQGAPAPRPVATYEEQQRLFDRLEEGLDAIRYLRGDRGQVLMHALCHLIGRAQPSPMEVKVLLGLAQQLRWVASQADLPEDC